VKGRRTIRIASIDQRGLAGQQFSESGDVPVFGGLDYFFGGIGHFVWIIK